MLPQLPSRHCVHVGGHLTANCKYLKWLQCLWIVTHLKEIENNRNARVQGERQRIPHDACELYRLSFLYLLEELERLHASVSMQKLKQMRSLFKRSFISRFLYFANHLKLLRSTEKRHVFAIDTQERTICQKKYVASHALVRTNFVAPHCCDLPLLMVLRI
jgi:hypothetical protein